MTNDTKIDIIAQRLQTLPARWKGCSQPEIIKIGVLCVVPSFIVAGIIGVAWLGGVFGFMVIGALGFGLGGGVMACGIILLGRYKAKKPEGYVVQRWRLVLQRMGIAKLPLITRSGHWMVGRRL